MAPLIWLLSWRARVVFTILFMYSFNEKVCIACLCHCSHNCIHVDIGENSTEEKTQRKRTTKTTKNKNNKTKDSLYSWRQEKKYFKKEEVINLSSGINRLRKRSTEDLLWGLIQSMSLVTLTTMFVKGEWGGRWWLERVQERTEEQEEK